MKVLALDHGFGNGGAQKILVDIVNYLSNKDGFTVKAVSTAEPGEVFDRLNSTVDKEVVDYSRSIFSVFFLRKLLKKNSNYLILCSSSRVFLALMLARLTTLQNNKVLLRYPSMPSLELEDKAISPIKFFLLRMVFKLDVRLIAQTEEMKYDLETTYRIKPKNIKVINNPINQELIKRSLKNSLSPYRDDNHNIVASGRLYPVKGFDILIRAFALACKNNHKLRLHIIGEDVLGLKSQYIELAKKEKCVDKITFHGHVTNPYPFYFYADLFVLCSRREGMPNALLENLYLNKKVVSSNCVPVIHRLVDKKHIYEVEDVMQLSKMLTNIQSLNKQKFAYQNTLKEFESLLMEIESDVTS